MENLNLDQIQDISGGDIDFQKELVELYTTGFSTAIANLETAILAKEQKNCILYSHDIKGSSANIGAEGVRKVAEKMEFISRDNKLEELGALLPSLRDSYNNTMDSFKKYFSQ